MRDSIQIKGARMHNLKNIDVEIPRNQLVVITGLSGSGKSSLAFDTLYAEGQRRYVESLSSYARQFLGKIDKPAVDNIEGIAPAIAIEQKVNSRSSRSTVGTATEVYDYLKLLFSRIGKTFSPKSGEEVIRHRPEDVFDFIHQFEEGTRVMVSNPISKKLKIAVKYYADEGFSRVLLDGKVKRLDELKGDESHQSLDLLVDRFSIKHDDDSNKSRIFESIERAYAEGSEHCTVHLENNGQFDRHDFNSKLELDGMSFEEPDLNFFSFNNPHGACKKCEGFGSIIGIDEDLVIPNKQLSIYEDAVVCWKGEKMSAWKDELILSAEKFDFPIHRPFYELSSEQKQLIWTGNEYFRGLNDFFTHLEEKSYKIQYRVMLSRYRGKTTCPDCKGTRLRPDANYVKVKGASITDLVLKSIAELNSWFATIELNEYEQKVSKRILTEIKSRLDCLEDVGLGYLNMNRLSSSLSGGETQRINLATSIGSSLVGSMYILDEPSIGLHPRDTERLIKVLQELKGLGNTVIIVEHDDEIIWSADYVIDLGPDAGSNGGKVVFEGGLNELDKATESWTARYLLGQDEISIPSKVRPWKQFIEVRGARENNLKGFDVKFPLGVFCAVTGVSGSGKTSLVSSILYPGLQKLLGHYGDKTGEHLAITGDFKNLSQVEFIDQNPIGKSSRSNPVTYIKAYDDIRSLFAANPLAKLRGYKAAHFSFNVDGGRCDVCKGEGTVTIEMQFMSDISMPCDNCHGKRFTEDVLEVKHRNKSISDILEMTIDEAMEFFSAGDSNSEKKVAQKLKPLQDVGLGYVHLGQSSNTLSGGEAQRIKLAFYLSKGEVEDRERILFIFDEPTTGLHFHDINKLLKSFNALIALGHSIIVIEHNMDVVKCADWVIDLGPEGGDAGGHLVFEGLPSDLAQESDSYTGKALKKLLSTAQ